MTLTNVRPEVLQKLGRRLQVPSLVRQARYTIGLASGDAPVAQRVGAAFLAELESAVERLVNDHTDRAMSAVRATFARQRVAEAVRQALDWRREYTQLVKVALLRDLHVPHDAAMSGRSRVPRMLASELQKFVRLGRRWFRALSTIGMTRDLLRQGAALAEAIRSADTEQQLARRARQSEAVQSMWESAARVFLAVRQVNAYGHAAHVHDRGAMDGYILKLLTGNSHPDAVQSRFIAQDHSALNSSASNGPAVESEESSLSRNRPTSSTAFSQSRMTVDTASRLPLETCEFESISGVRVARVGSFAPPRHFDSLPLVQGDSVAWKQ